MREAELGELEARSSPCRHGVARRWWCRIHSCCRACHHACCTTCAHAAGGICLLWVARRAQRGSNVQHPALSSHPWVPNAPPGRRVRIMIRVRHRCTPRARHHWQRSVAYGSAAFGPRRNAAFACVGVVGGTRGCPFEPRARREGHNCGRYVVGGLQRWCQSTWHVRLSSWPATLHRTT